MGAGDPQIIPLPKSYASLPYTQIKMSHVPESAPEATAVVVVTLYRPKNYNAFTNTIMREMEEAFQLFDIDDRVKCIVLTGYGKMFCAGADLVSGTGFNPGVRVGYLKSGLSWTALLTICRVRISDSLLARNRFEIIKMAADV